MTVNELISSLTKLAAREGGEVPVKLGNEEIGYLATTWFDQDNPHIVLHPGGCQDTNS